MRRTILSVLGVALISASSLEIAAAAEHHQLRRTHKMDHAAVTDEFRRANGSVIPPSVSLEDDEGHRFSAPAGRS